MCLDILHKLSREVAHPPPEAARTETTPPTRKRDRAAPAAVSTFGQDQPLRKDPAAQEGLHLGHDERGQHRRLGHRLQLTDERLPVDLHCRVEDRLLGPVPFIAVCR